MIPIPRDAVPFDGCLLCGRVGVYNCCGTRQHALEFLSANDGEHFNIAVAPLVARSPEVLAWVAEVKRRIVAEMKRELASLAE